MRNPIRIFTVMFVLVLSLFAVSASAQTSTTGSIEGTVLDVNGAAVPGVEVTVTSPNLIRAQTATTDDEGNYRNPNLPPAATTCPSRRPRLRPVLKANSRSPLKTYPAPSAPPAGRDQTVEVTQLRRGN